MTTYVKDLSRQIHVYDKDGNQVTMSERSFLVNGAKQGYSRTKPKTIAEMNQQELVHVKNADLKAYLDANAIAYAPDAKKDDLIAAVIGK